MSYLVALMIAFLFTLASPQAALASVDTGWSDDAHKYELSAIYAEPVSFKADRQKDGATDTVFGVYSALPYASGYFKSNESKLVMRHGHKNRVSGYSDYKDRPGWRL
jgi:hypothetical protein